MNLKILEIFVASFEQALDLMHQGRSTEVVETLAPLEVQMTQEYPMPEVSFAAMQCLRLYGISLVQVGEHQRGRTILQNFVSKHPSDSSSSMHLAFSILAQCEYQAGFKQLLMPTFDHPRNTYPYPLWRGKKTPGKRIVLYDGSCNDNVRSDYGNGYGDSIQFIRYVKRLRHDFNEITLKCDPPLVGLMKTFSEIDRVVTSWDEVETADVRLPLIHFPHVYSTSIESIPYTNGYLEPFGSSDKSDSTRLRVGICWRGAEHHYASHRRNFDLQTLLQTLSKAGVTIVNLQHLPKPAELRLLSEFDVEHSAEKLEGFLRTSHLIGTLDLVVSIDTSIAHLTGAMNKPGIVLLPYACDWRWLPDGPWYDSLKTIRQTSYGDWNEVEKELNRYLTPISRTKIRQ